MLGTNLNSMHGSAWMLVLNITIICINSSLQKGQINVLNLFIYILPGLNSKQYQNPCMSEDCLQPVDYVFGFFSEIFGGLYFGGGHRNCQSVKVNSPPTIISSYMVAKVNRLLSMGTQEYAEGGIMKKSVTTWDRTGELGCGGAYHCRCTADPTPGHPLLFSLFHRHVPSVFHVIVGLAQACPN